MKFQQTINLAHVAMGAAFKKRAPKCINAIKKIAMRTTKVQDIIIGEDVNVFVWSNGIRQPPRKIRVEIEVKEQDSNKFAVVSLLEVDTFKGLRTEQQQ